MWHVIDAAAIPRCSIWFVKETGADRHGSPTLEPASRARPGSKAASVFLGSAWSLEPGRVPIPAGPIAAMRVRHSERSRSPLHTRKWTVVPCVGWCVEIRGRFWKPYRFYWHEGEGWTPYRYYLVTQLTQDFAEEEW